ncbi:LPXTG cell wall anchor domain-containing protein [Enterococcus sp. 669A]|uniref:LPXTG cell wall anchor domain-containing protein n=1 Tax=Candidatus Enterococcus moelleringii TaxID=2815325 RepID=A0ABS3LGM6_9ENTE|nr:LPXTG cell wall anchor domain-containing protein [Enterococcus sp. 669A]MBO1308787.1 LPXTG cell wall anchor domain-containing protein [Enterococcus sp. 669A]
MKKKTRYLIGIAAISLLALSGSAETFAGESQGSRATVSVLSDDMEEPVTGIEGSTPEGTEHSKDPDPGSSGSESTEPSSSESHEDGTKPGTGNSGNKQDPSNQGAQNNSNTSNNINSGIAVNSNTQNVSHSNGNQHKQYPQTNDRYTPLYSILGGIILLAGLAGIYITHKKKGENKNEKN